ncbi:MAG: glycosyltransferase, partial [Bacteroidota bacterium]
LEAFALGIAVVASELAVRGLPIENQIHYIQAQKPEEWVIALKQLANPNERKRIGTNARKFIEQEFNTKKIGSDFVQNLKSIRKK